MASIALLCLYVEDGPRVKFERVVVDDGNEAGPLEHEHPSLRSHSSIKASNASLKGMQNAVMTIM